MGQWRASRCWRRLGVSYSRPAARLIGLGPSCAIYGDLASSRALKNVGKAGPNGSRTAAPAAAGLDELEAMANGAVRVETAMGPRLDRRAVDRRRKALPDRSSGHGSGLVEDVLPARPRGCRSRGGLRGDLQGRAGMSSPNFAGWGMPICRRPERAHDRQEDHGPGREGYQNTDIARMTGYDLTRIYRVRQQAAQAGKR